jgi:hypothetical protein
LPRFGFRIYVLGGLFILVNTIVHAIATWEPARLSAQQFPDEHDDHLSAWFQTFWGFDLLGAAANLGGAVAGFLLVTLPFFVIFRPGEYAEANMLKHGVEHRRSARISGIAMVVLLILTFLVPTLIVFGSQEDVPWMVITGWVLVPVGVVAVVIAAAVQRPDRARRNAAGLIK